ncbi:hypothetical protein [Rhizobium indigoferae]|uniref:Uncharacterized protein n=1 Tax=Rhizobium indigoferae TaxID=158891 RepID=A0ABZ0Z6F0_9HYPH|nr:hypothetical protein [Rhizobium indigoferae]NNU57225.1 hypothetical protein [Rhizobium indigoferae]WQN35152.1 hypothetical protein U5G49_000175 [Rhizobium indigoferae]GLR60288.1 hypothetical protein GCM10007919_50160 [Rhizobium indigoferae]
MRRLSQPDKAIVSLETELANLNASREKLLAQRVAAIDELDKARADRRESLGQNADIVATSAAVRDLKARIMDLDELLGDVDHDISEISERLARERGVHDRNERADALEKIASATDKRAREIEVAVAGLKLAVIALRAELPEDIKLWPTHYAHRPHGSVDDDNPTASPREVVAGVLADALARALPDLFDLSLDGYYRSALSRIMVPKGLRADWASDEPTQPLTAVKACEALISEPLRDLANEIRAGTASVSERGRPQVTYLKDPSPSRPPDEEVFVTSSLSYFATSVGPPLICGRGRAHMLPKPVADLAIWRELGHRMSSPEGIEALEEAKRRRERIRGYGDGAIRHDDCVALGDVLGLRASEDEIAEVERAIG